MIRKPRPGPKAAVVEQFDYIGRRAVGQIIDAYERERSLEALRKNKRVAALAGLKVGKGGIPWPWGVLSGRGLGPYVQSVDTYRARALLGDDNARWEIYFPPGVRIGTPYVRRVV